MRRILQNHFTFENFRNNVHLRISMLLKLILILGTILSFLEGRYQTAVETLIILMITFLPLLLGRRFQVHIPHIFESLAVVFVYSTLFLGEMQGYYLRFWWWDLVLHAGSGFLLGVIGFLLVYVLNEKPEIDMYLSPFFMALFAFMFAMGIGALWEIFEFAMDQIYGMNMQKSGLVDTMWDLIVDGIGAFIISCLGWVYMRRPERTSFLERWIAEFIEHNPRLFRSRESADEEIRTAGDANPASDKSS